MGGTPPALRKFLDPPLLMVNNWANQCRTMA